MPLAVQTFAPGSLSVRDRITRHKEIRSEKKENRSRTEESGPGRRQHGEEKRACQTGSGIVSAAFRVITREGAART